MIWANSKYVNPGDTFLASDDNYKYIDLKLLKKTSKIIFTGDKNKYIYDHFYNKIKDLTLIGITGTNGKTTTCYLIYQMLNMMNVNTPIIAESIIFPLKKSPKVLLLLRAKFNINIASFLENKAKTIFLLKAANLSLSISI